MAVALHLFTLLLLVALGFYVFVADPRRRSHQTFAAFIAFFALWTVKDIIFWNFYPRDSAAGWWAAASFVAALMMQFSFAVFAWVFPENSRTPRQKAAILFAPGMVLIPAAFLGLLWDRVGFENGTFVLELTILAYAFVGYLYFIFGYSTYILLQKYRAYKGTQRGQQVGAIILGSLLTGLLYSAVIFAFPFFGYPGLLSISSMFVLPGALIYAYAILNFELFSLKTALNQFRLFPLTYKIALSIGTIAVASFLVLQIPITYWAFRNGMDAESWRRYLVFSIVAALLPNLLLHLFVLRIVSRPIQRITLAAIAVTRGEYGKKVGQRRSNDEIGILADSFDAMSSRMATDLAQLKKLNEQLIRTEKLATIGTLAAGVADDIGPPLSAVSSIIDKMRSEEGHSVDTRNNLFRIDFEVGRIRRLMKELSSLAHSRPVEQNIVDINEVIKTAVAMAHADQCFHDLEVRVEASKEKLCVFADPNQLEQVFLNLLMNVREKISENGRLTLRTTVVDRDVVIEIISDNLNVESESVSVPAVQTSVLASPTPGMSICASIVTALNGSIVDNRSESSRPDFKIILPRHT